MNDEANAEFQKMEFEILELLFGVGLDPDFEIIAAANKDQDQD